FSLPPVAIEIAALDSETRLDAHLTDSLSANDYRPRRHGTVHHPATHHRSLYDDRAIDHSAHHVVAMIAMITVAAGSRYRSRQATTNQGEACERRQSNDAFHGCQPPALSSHLGFPTLMALMLFET